MVSWIVRVGFVVPVLCLEVKITVGFRSSRVTRGGGPVCLLMMRVVGLFSVRLRVVPLPRSLVAVVVGGCVLESILGKVLQDFVGLVDSLKLFGGVVIRIGIFPKELRNRQ